MQHTEIRITNIKINDDVETPDYGRIRRNSW